MTSHYCMGSECDICKNNFTPKFIVNNEISPHIRIDAINEQLNDLKSYVKTLVAHKNMQID